jgi:hypothetical protein
VGGQTLSYSAGCHRPRDGAIIFSVTWSASSTCSTLSATSAVVAGGITHRLIERYGIDAKLFDWSDEITADCSRKQAKNLNDQCGARCPDLSKVV